MNYQFPATKFVRETTYDEQMDKVREEWAELSHEYQIGKKKHNDDRIIEEALDMIHAIEGLLRKFPEEAVSKQRTVVINKNLKRGYYQEIKVGGTD